ncbi:TetR/AcrR family transcriptional regulator [Arthrobacter sp. D3-16]
MGDLYGLSAAARPPVDAMARERILHTAARLFYTRGLRAVGVDEIIAKSGTAKATFYRHFPAKNDLILAYLDVADQVWTRQLHAAAGAAGPDPGHQLVGLFDALDSVIGHESFRGCAFINAAAEAAPGTPTHDRAMEHKRQVLGWITDLARRAGAQEPDRLARTLTLLLDGALASGAQEDGVAATARQAARLLVRVSVQLHQSAYTWKISSWIRCDGPNQVHREA